MLGLDNPLHIAIILVVVLLVFGAKRLPEMGKSLGEGLRGFKSSVSGDSDDHHMAVDKDDRSPAISELNPAHPDEPATVAADRTPAAPVV